MALQDGAPVHDSHAVAHKVVQDSGAVGSQLRLLVRNGDAVALACGARDVLSLRVGFHSDQMFSRSCTILEVRESLVVWAPLHHIGNVLRLLVHGHGADDGVGRRQSCLVPQAEVEEANSFGWKTDNVPKFPGQCIKQQHSAADSKGEIIQAEKAHPVLLPPWPCA